MQKNVYGSLITTVEVQKFSPIIHIKMAFIQSLLKIILIYCVKQSMAGLRLAHSKKKKYGVQKLKRKAPSKILPYLPSLKVLWNIFFLAISCGAHSTPGSYGSFTDLFLSTSGNPAVRGCQNYKCLPQFYRLYMQIFCPFI